MDGKKLQLQMFPLNELPEGCLAEVMRHLSPDDVGRLACVSATFAAAARSHTVWEVLVPRQHGPFWKMASPARPIAPAHPHGSPSLELYKALRKGVYFNNGRYHLDVNPLTGQFRISISVAQAMEVTWSRHRGRPELWAKTPAIRTSPFLKTGHLAVIHWTKIKCELDLCLPPGSYSVMWRLGREYLPEDEDDLFEQHPNSPADSPPLSPGPSSPTCSNVNNTRAGRMGVSFICLEVGAQSKIAVKEGKPVIAAVPISQENVAVVPQWTEFKVAEIFVDANSEKSDLCRVQLEAELKDTPRRKVALYADSLVLESQQPTAGSIVKRLKE